MKHTQKRQSKKRELLLESAQELLFNYGVRRVTVEEICKKAGVSKMTCYKYFADKWEIARAVLDSLIDRGMAAFQEMTLQDIPFSAKVEQMLLQTTHQIHAVGPGLLEDMMRQDSPLHGYYVEMQKKTRRLSVDFFMRAQQQGHIHADLRMPVLLFMFDHLSDLVNHPDLVNLMPDIQDRASELAALLFYGFARKP